MENNSQNDNEKTAHERNVMAMGSSIGINMAIGMFICASGGLYLEKKYGSSYWTLAGIVLGLFYMGYQTWKIVQEINNKD